MTYKQLTAKLRAVAMGEIRNTDQVRRVLQASRRKEQELLDKSEELAQSRYDAEETVGTAWVGELGAID